MISISEQVSKLTDPVNYFIMEALPIIIFLIICVICFIIIVKIKNRILFRLSAKNKIVKCDFNWITQEEVDKLVSDSKKAK